MSRSCTAVNTLDSVAVQLAVACLDLLQPGQGVRVRRISGEQIDKPLLGAGELVFAVPQRVVASRTRMTVTSAATYHSFCQTLR